MGTKASAPGSIGIARDQIPLPNAPWISHLHYHARPHDLQHHKPVNLPSYHNWQALALKSLLKCPAGQSSHVKAVVLKKDPGVHSSLGRGVGLEVVGDTEVRNVVVGIMDVVGRREGSAVGTGKGLVVGDGDGNSVEGSDVGARDGSMVGAGLGVNVGWSSPRQEA